MVVAAQVAVAEVSRSRRLEGAAAVVLAAAGVEQEVAVDTRTAGAVWENTGQINSQYQGRSAIRKAH